MARRKQRRRREKLQRHEWEYVLETEEGEEIPLKSPRPRRKEEDEGGSGRDRGPLDRRGRPVQKPSFQRVLKRTGIFAPLLFLVVWITSPHLTTIQKLTQTAFLLSLFIPFSYLLDVLLYRALLRRQRGA